MNDIAPDPDSAMNQRVTLGKKAYNSIIERIMDGRLRMGQVFTEDTLNRELGMSKTPIREAITSLENEGVVSKNGRSYSIVYLEKEQIDEIYEFKREVETLAAYLAATRMSTILRANLKEVNDTLTKISKDDTNPVNLANLSGKLHAIIARGSGNGLVEKNVTNMRLMLRIVRVSLFAISERRVEEIREHTEITRAILDEDADRARKAMYDHQTDVWNYVKNSIVPRLYY